jgi:hypothetical protein
MFDSYDTAKLFKINTSTTLRLIDDFVKLRILKEMTEQKQNRNFVFEKYVKLFK